MKKEFICKREVMKNILLAEQGLPLTYPLRLLKEECEFETYWDRLGKPLKEKEAKAHKKAYYQRKKRENLK